MILPESDVVRRAESILVRAKLAILEDEALATLRNQPGLALAPLWPPSVVIQIVTLNAMHVGRVQLDNPGHGYDRWIAVPLLPAKPHGPYPSARAAAESLVLGFRQYETMENRDEESGRQ